VPPRPIDAPIRRLLLTLPAHLCERWEIGPETSPSLQAGAEGSPRRSTRVRDAGGQ